MSTAFSNCHLHLKENLTFGYYIHTNFINLFKNPIQTRETNYAGKIFVNEENIHQLRMPAHYFNERYIQTATMTAAVMLSKRLFLSVSGEKTPFDYTWFAFRSTLNSSLFIKLLHAKSSDGILWRILTPNTSLSGI